MIAFPIWSPRYWDKKVLVDRLKVKKEKCYIYFCCDRNYKDLYSFDGERVINDAKLCSNGKIICYEIPLEWLNNEGVLPSSYEKIKQQEYEKFLRRKKPKK